MFFSSIIIISYWLMMHPDGLSGNAIMHPPCNQTWWHSGKYPPQLLVSRNMTASEKVDGAVLKDITWLCRNPGFVDRSWTCQLLLVLISETWSTCFVNHSLAATHHCRSSCYRIPFKSSAIQDALYKHSKLGNVFLFSKGLTFKYPYNTIWYLSAKTSLQKMKLNFPTYGHMMPHCQL